MYPTAVHKIFTQTIDVSQVFEKWYLQKQPKTINKITKKLGQKDNQRFGTRRSQTSPRVLPLIVFVQDNFVLVKNIFLISHVAYALFYSIMNLGGKRLLISKNLITLMLTKHCTVQNFENLYDAFSSYRAITSCALHSGSWLFVCMSKSIDQIQFFSLRRSQTLGQPWSTRFSIFLPIKLPRTLNFSVPTTKYSSFTSLLRLLRSWL